MKLRNVVIVGAAVFVLGIIALAVGQQAIFTEMDAADAAGAAGTLFGFGGLTTIAGLILTLTGAIVLIAAAVKRVRRIAAPA